MKTISVLGSTGSVGTQALRVAKNIGCKVLAMSADKNIKLIEEQAREFLPRYIVIVDPSAAADLKIRLADTDIKVLPGKQNLEFIAALPEADVVLNSVVGTAGLVPTLAAISAGKTIAFANKETLVAGGGLVKAALAQNPRAKLLPVDSEHSAIFRCLETAGGNRPKKLILTASGGPFFGRTRAELDRVTVADALKHPNWSMGAKLTVDSATLMNKALELVEAVHLFDISAENIEIVVNRQSILHSAVEFADGTVVGQMSTPSMKIPIQYAFTYPDILPCPDVPPLDFAALAGLTFHKPDFETFGCPGVMFAAHEKSPLATALVNAANDRAVALFIEGKIRFTDIERLVRRAFEEINLADVAYDLDGVFFAESEAAEFVNRCVPKS